MQKFDRTKVSFLHRIQRVGGMRGGGGWGRGGNWLCNFPEFSTRLASARDAADIVDVARERRIPSRRLMRRAVRDQGIARRWPTNH